MREEGIEIILKAPEPDRMIVPAHQLRMALVALPVSAWPYGRVVAASEVGIYGVSKDGEVLNKLTKQNMSKAKQILKSLQVAVNWLPS